ncbi:MAG: hypothetical protein SFU55_01105 [Methylophilus sp.]|nr:hypothetical protein [Methylophilus sp.]
MTVHLRFTNHSTLILIYLFSLYFSATSAFAKDIVIEQHNASEARSEYNNAKANYESITQQIANQEKRITEEQAKLKNLQEQQIAAKNHLEQAQVDLDAKVKILEEAWEHRNQ